MRWLRMGMSISQELVIFVFPFPSCAILQFKGSYFLDSERMSSVHTLKIECIYCANKDYFEDKFSYLFQCFYCVLNSIQKALLSKHCCSTLKPLNAYLTSWWTTTVHYSFSLCFSSRNVFAIGPNHLKQRVFCRKKSKTTPPQDSANNCCYFKD